MGLIFLIDDDEMTRELLSLIAPKDGSDWVSCESGEAALDQLTEIPEMPFAVVADMHMPGICGNALALKLRERCGSGTRLIAMSGSAVSPVALSEFDGFLLKPFTARELLSACTDDGATTKAGLQRTPILNGAVYANLSRSMHPEQVKGLYKMCLHDAETRIETMRGSIAKNDQATYRRAAHTIKGGCGMVGASELAALAGVMEIEGFPETGSTPLESFLAALERLRRMLECKVSGT